MNAKKNFVIKMFNCVYYCHFYEFMSQLLKININGGQLSKFEIRMTNDLQKCFKIKGGKLFQYFRWIE